MFPTAENFHQQAFPDLNLGDKRRQARFQKVAQSCLDHPEGSLPDKFRDRNDYDAALNLFARPECSHQNLIDAHCFALLERLESSGPSVVLFIHDTTDLDYSNQRTLEPYLGQIGNGGGRGFLCHNCICVDPDSRQIFGLGSQILHIRPFVDKNESVADKRARENRESRLWLHGLNNIGPAPVSKTWVHIADRGADIFEFLQPLVDRAQAFVIRSTHNRKLHQEKPKKPRKSKKSKSKKTAEQPLEQSKQEQCVEQQHEEGTQLLVQKEDGTPHLLHDYLESLDAGLSWIKEVTPTAQRQGRFAQMKACAAKVTIAPPHVRKGEYRKEAITLWAIRVWEETPGIDKEETLEWVLLTSQDCSKEEDLLKVVGWYESRIVVEEYHKAQKTGMGTEKLQLQDVEAIKAVIALLSVIAVAIVNLRIAARDQEKAKEDAEKYVPHTWVKVLSIWRYKQVRKMTVLEFTMALAKLGGHLNRKSDGLPGWLTLWRGWERLHTMLDYELSRPTSP